VGEVPVVKYLTAFNIDEVGYTLRTASLMTDPEVYFDENIPSDYPLFGARWLLYPTGMLPIVPGKIVMQRGQYTLWRLPTSGYLQVVDTVGSLIANRTDIGRNTASVLTSDLAGRGRYLTVAFAGVPAARPTLAPRQQVTAGAGRVVSSSVVLIDGRASAIVVARRPAVVVLKASYDPGWHVLVDGKSVPTEMLAPAYVGVAVPAGRHHVQFTYESGADERLLFSLAVLGFVLLVIVHLWERRRVPDSVQRTP
jgi:hypothetical protein